jgi:GDP-D-mannose dehydratase
MTNPVFRPEVVLIAGIAGRDCRYLAKFLLGKGCAVHGIKRRSSSFKTSQADHIYQDPHIDTTRFKLRYCDLSDTSYLTRIMQDDDPARVKSKLGSAPVITLNQMSAALVVHDLAETKKDAWHMQIGYVFNVRFE